MRPHHFPIKPVRILAELLTEANSPRRRGRPTSVIESKQVESRRLQIT